MIKGKTLLQILACLIITLLISNNSYARLIKPEPKPSEYRKDIPAKVKKPSRKVTPEVLTPKKPVQVNKAAPLKKSKPEKKIKKEVKKNKVEEKSEKFLVSNEIIPIKKPLDLGMANKNSSVLSTKDFLIAQKTFNLIKRKRWNTALQEVRKSRSALLNNLVFWMYLKEPINRLNFYDYKKFIEKNPEWPRINRLRYLAEHKINSKDVKTKDVIKFFEKVEPLSGYGKIMLGEAFLTKGEKQKAHDLISDGFKTANLSTEDHRYLNKKYKNLLTNDDYIERAKYLAWEQDFYELRRTLRYLPKGYKELYFARFALMTRSYGVDSAIAKVPPQFKNDIGLQFDRAKWRRKRGRYDSALEIINQLPQDPKLLVKPDLWFKEKFIIARSRINKKRFETRAKLAIKPNVLYL